MNYTLDPARMSLDRFFELTASRKMLPGRKALHESMEERLRQLHHAGVNTLSDILKRLGTKKKLEAFAENTGIPSDYLVLLKREAGSYMARPFPLDDFPGIPFEYTEVLKSRGIRQTRDFFESAYLPEQREELASQTGIPAERLRELWELCDLSRITGIGGVFARVVYETGIRSTEEFSGSDPAEQYDRYLEIIRTRGYRAGHFSREDLAYCIRYARTVREYDQDDGPAH